MPHASLQQSSACRELLVDEVRDDLGIGFRDDLATGADQFLTELDVIFDDAVVNDDDVAAAMRMSILLRRAAVRCPARMADARGAVSGRYGSFAARLSSLPTARECGSDRRDRRDTRRIVTAILELRSPASKTPSAAR